MSTWNTEALFVEASGAAEALPNPSTVGGRTHVLFNNSNVTQTWSSTGATPFVVNGANAATLVLAVGESRRVYSNGTRWVVLATVRAQYAEVKNTGANGIVTFTFPVGRFTSPPVVSATPRESGSSANGSFAELTRAVTTTDAQVQVWSGKGVLIGGTTTDPAGSGVPVHLIAVEAG